MSMTIGELAQRLRVTTRTLRHYEQLGLLQPESVDARTGYRAYGSAQLLRGIRIEQLKGTGLPLATIRDALDGAAPLGPALLARRAEVEVLVAAHARQLATIDALLATDARVAAPSDAYAPACVALVARCTTSAETLAPTIRRSVQRLRRAARAAGAPCTSFSARFPLRVEDGAFTVDVAAHLVAPVPGSVELPGERRLGVELVGAASLLALAYDAVLSTARERGLPLAGCVVEHYLQLGRIGRTEVALPLLVNR